MPFFYKEKVDPILELLIKSETRVHSSRLGKNVEGILCLRFSI